MFADRIQSSVWWPAVAFCAAVVGLIPRAEADLLTFTNLIDSAGGFQSFATASLNNAGQVAFWARTDGNLVNGLYRREVNGSVTTIADSSGFYRTFNSSIVSMAENGIVAGIATFDSSSGFRIITGDGISQTTIVDSRVTGFNAGTNLAVNSSGRVVFRGTDGTNSGIYTGDGGAVTTLIDESAGYDGLSAIGEPVLNDNGTAAFWVNPTSGPRRVEFIDAATGGNRATIIQDGDFGLGSVNALTSRIDLSASDELLVAALGSGNSGLAHFTDTRSQQFATRRTQLNSPAGSDGDRSLNTSGMIVFQSGNTIYDGTTTTPVPLINVGDTLFGSTINFLSYDREGLNDSGLFAFTYGLENGVVGIALAGNGAAVPEPSQLFRLVGGALFISVVRRRRRAGVVLKSGPINAAGPLPGKAD